MKRYSRFDFIHTDSVYQKGQVLLQAILVPVCTEYVMYIHTILGPIKTEAIMS